MSWWTDIRDAIESVAVVAGNFFLPGSGLVTSQLVSEGSQEQLGSPLGQMALLGSGISGGASGNLSNYGKAWNSLTGAESAADLAAGGGPAADYAGGWDAAAGPGGMSILEGAGSGTGNWATNAWNNMKSLGSSPMSTVSNWAKSTGAMPWGSPGNLMSMGSGLYGLYQSNQLKKMAQMASQQADPWGTSGGRALAGGQLQDLMQNPSGVTKLPGYQAGLEAVQRSMAAQGYQGSGNMMAALQKYGGDFYNNAISQLGGLAGAQFNPAAGGELALRGTGMGTDVASRSLATLGYGVQRTQPNQVPPWLQ